MDRLFLDANVLFSAAYREGAGLAVLWRLEDVELVTSRYAVEEAQRNLDTDEQRDRLDELLAEVEVVGERPLPEHLPEGLRAKDAPILAAAIASDATHLVTGDRRDFGPLLGRRLSGVLVVTPRAYLLGRSR